MLLSDRDLRVAVQSGRLFITPYEPGLIQPSSIDVRLGPRLLVWPDDGQPIDPAQPNPMVEVVIDGDQPYPLRPGQMALGCTVESVRLAADLAVRVEGKSSLGRLGLAVHVTAGFVDPGFAGQITLELVNHAPRPLLLRPGMLIAQLCAIQMSSPVEHPYGSPAVGSHYQRQHGPTASRSHIGWRTQHTRPERSR